MGFRHKFSPLLQNAYISMPYQVLVLYSADPLSSQHSILGDDIEFQMLVSHTLGSTKHNNYAHWTHYSGDKALDDHVYSGSLTVYNGGPQVAGYREYI